MAVGSNSASMLGEQKGKISSGNGNTTCHQCCHKAMGLAASCKNKKAKPCTITFCQKCLLNRYGEKVEEVTVLEEWRCPKCRGICNCSYCRKKQGHRPTGRLVHTAKATGFSSVSELLRVKGPQNYGIDKIVTDTDTGPADIADSNNEPAVAFPKKRGKENSFENSNTSLHPQPLPSNVDENKQKRIKLEGLTEIQDIKCGKNKINSMKFQKKDIYASIQLPRGTELTSVAGIEVPPEDVGHALQFLEFCATFCEILHLKDGEPEYVLVELKRGGRGCRGKHSPVSWFHIQLLSLIQEDLGEKSPLITTKDGKNSWLNVLHNCASRSQNVLGNLKLESFDGEFDDYDRLDFSEKLRILNFLCDEFLCTVKIRRWIDAQNSQLAEKVKEANERVLAAKLKEKQLKQKMQDEVSKAIIANNGAPLSISEHEALVLQIKNEGAQAHAQILKSKATITKEKERSNAIRTEPLLMDASGHIYWRLKECSDDESNLLLQDLGSCDSRAMLSEKWFTLDVEQGKEIEKYIHSFRNRRPKPQKFPDNLPPSSSEPELNDHLIHPVSSTALLGLTCTDSATCQGKETMSV